MLNDSFSHLCLHPFLKYFSRVRVRATRLDAVVLNIHDEQDFLYFMTLVGVRVADPVAIQTRSSGRFSGRFRRGSSTGSRVALTSPLNLLETIQHCSGPLTHSAEKISLYSMTYEYNLLTIEIFSSEISRKVENSADSNDIRA